MSAWGRLWRRAPAWRFCLFTAVTATALAAMFPPTPPAWRPTWWPQQGGMVGSPRFTPQPSPVAPRYTISAFPALGPGRSGIIPFAGHQLPLPLGSWQELLLIRGSGELMFDVMVLGRIEDGRLTGLIEASTPSLPGTAGGRAELPPGCLATDALAHRITAANPNDPTDHECWTLVPTNLTQGVWQAGQQTIEGLALRRLGDLHVNVPEHALLFNYIRTNDGGVQHVTIALPDERVRQHSQVQRLQEWADRFETKLNQGFLGTLAANDLTPAVARDPR